MNNKKKKWLHFQESSKPCIPRLPCCGHKVCQLHFSNFCSLGLQFTIIDLKANHCVYFYSNKNYFRISTRPESLFVARVTQMLQATNFCFYFHLGIKCRIFSLEIIIKAVNGYDLRRSRRMRSNTKRLLQPPTNNRKPINPRKIHFPSKEIKELPLPRRSGIDEVRSRNDSYLIIFIT